MIKTVINLVKIESEDNKFLTDLKKSGTFKSVTCSMDDMDKYLEITAEEAEVINQGIIGSVDA